MQCGSRLLLAPFLYLDHARLIPAAIFNFSQDAFSKLRASNFDKRRTKVSKRKCEFTKALFELTNYYDKDI